LKYFKNTELAALYHVSEKSVRNWIESATGNKLALQILEKDGKKYVANTARNIALIDQLVEKGKKYKNTRGHKVIRPTETFYKAFNATEIFNIIANLDTHHEIPLEYSYFDGGAKIWDSYVNKLSQDETPNILSNTVYLLGLNAQYIDDLLENCDAVNVIDIGPGNGYPVRELLGRLSTEGRLNRYIAIDASRTMLDIAKSNIYGWFGDDIRLETYTRDITYERFGDLLAEDSFGKNVVVKNIVLLLGSTLSNFRDPSLPLTTIRESMGKNDLLISSKQLDTPHSRRHFDYYTGDETKFQLAPKSKFLLDLFNIDESLYEAESSFDEMAMSRRLLVRLKVALSIEFMLEDKQRVINFNKGDAILIWRHKHQDIVETIEQLNENGFDLLQATSTRDREFVLTISKIRTGY